MKGFGSTSFWMGLVLMTLLIEGVGCYFLGSVRSSSDFKSNALHVMQPNAWSLSNTMHRSLQPARKIAISNESIGLECQLLSIIENTDKGVSATFEQKSKVRICSTHSFLKRRKIGSRTQ